MLNQSRREQRPDLRRFARFLYVFAVLCTLNAAAPPPAIEHFDADPGWDGVNNRPIASPCRPVVQAFGYIDSGEERGRIGGTITPDGRAAYYAKPIPPSNQGQAVLCRFSGKWTTGCFRK